MIGLVLNGRLVLSDRSKLILGSKQLDFGPDVRSLLRQLKLTEKEIDGIELGKSQGEDFGRHTGSGQARGRRRVIPPPKEGRRREKLTPDQTQHE